MQSARIGPALLETLNPSVGGWAPANELGWLEAKGVLESQIAILVINEGDLFQPLSWDATGIFPQFPKRKPLCALAEAWSRYLLPRIKRVKVRDPGTGQDPFKPEVAEAVRASIRRMIQICRAQEASPVLLYVHSRTQEPGKAQALVDLQSMVAGEGAQFITADLQPSHYVDNYHLNSEGNSKIAQQIAPVIATIVDL